MKVELLTYFELTDEERKYQPGNGSGADMASYYRIKYNENDIEVESDAMEPEDATFDRDLSWIKKALVRAYEQGQIDAKSEMLNE